MNRVLSLLADTGTHLMSDYSGLSGVGRSGSVVDSESIFSCRELRLLRSA
jgi:hypothetical protein